MHCIRLYNKIDPYLTSNKEKIGSIRPRSVNDQLTTLPFGGIQKYYDGSVALYVYFFFFLSVIQQSQSFFLIRSNKEKLFFFRTLS